MCQGYPKPAAQSGGMPKKTLTALLLTCAVTVLGVFAEEPKDANKPEWIERSDRVTQKLLEIRFDDQPEGGSQEGVTRYDREISVPTLANETTTMSRERALAVLIEASLKK